MFTEKQKEAILDSILNTGHAEEVIETPRYDNIYICDKDMIGNITNVASGRRRFNPKFIKLAQLIIQQPDEFKDVSNLAIRCCLCGKTIAFPAWYAIYSYAVTKLHYFVCHDKSAPTKPTMRCYFE